MKPARVDTDPISQVTPLQLKLLERLLARAAGRGHHRVRRGGTHQDSLELEVELREPAGEGPFHWEHYAGVARCLVHLAPGDDGLPYAVVSARRSGRGLQLGMIPDGGIVPLRRPVVTFDGSSIDCIEVHIGNRSWNFPNTFKFSTDS